MPTGCCRPGQPGELDTFSKRRCLEGRETLCAQCQLLIPFLRDPGLLEHRECLSSQAEEKVWRILMVDRQVKRGRA